MQRRFTRFSLVLGIFLSGNAWALGLGEIRLDSALNAPLRAEIELLSAAPEELDGLSVALASQETFERYGIDKPFYLQDLRFEIVRSGGAEGNYVRITSSSPITEPFLTFLVEATWSRGRLLREYTVLLDPPTFAPPAAAQTRPAVTAPQRATPADSARIERPPQTQTPAREAPAREAPPQPQPRPVPAPPQRTQPAVSEDTTPPDVQPGRPSGGNYVVQRGQTLWGIASQFLPDSQVSMNQAMLAIYEANPEAFGGNINLLRAGASLRIPGADEIYRIDRAYALNEARRQHAEWEGRPAPGPVEDQVATTTRPSLQLVPPDEEPAGVGTGTEGAADGEPVTREQEILDRIAELEAADVPQQRSLIEIRDNELASLRRELAEIRGEVYEPPVDDTAADALQTDDADEVADDDLFADAEADIAGAGDAEAADSDADTAVQPPSNVISAPTRPEPSLLDRIVGALTSIWAIIGGAVIVAAGVLLWFVRRGRDDDELESWTSAGAESPDLDDTVMSATESLRAPSQDESIVVVEQGSGERALDDDTLDEPGPRPGLATEDDTASDFGSLEDTFSSDTAVNLDQSDPIAEADFHMAYGLYDQAADLVNGALSTEPERLDLLTKLCEIYFVWGNRDAFIDAAARVKNVATEGDSSEWDKIVIMGQQIAADHELFAGAAVAGATKAVDLSFESDMDEASELDMDFGAAAESGDDVIDLGGDADATRSSDSGVDFVLDQDASAGEDDGLDFDITRESPTMEAAADDSTSELPRDESTVETLTIEEQFVGLDSTSELPSISEAVGEAVADSDKAAEATAEINLDELGLDLDALDETEVASLDDELDATANHEVVQEPDLEEAADETGKNPEIDTDVTGVEKVVDDTNTSLNEALDIEEALSATSEMRLAADETGQNPLMQQADEDDVDFDESLLDATGHTQILPEDFAVEPTGKHEVIADDAETRLASLDDDDADDAGELGDEDATMLAPSMDDDDFDFARTEALPKDVFAGNSGLDETGEMPAVASTDVDLDLDDLTAALKVSELGDTVDMPRDDATVEHVRPAIDDETEAETMSLAPEDMSDDLHEARTMTEVGTKLDLARAYVDMGDPGGARSILEEVLDEGDDSQRQQAQQLLDTLPG